MVAMSDVGASIRLSDASRPRVLIIFPGALGDLICFLPALRAIVRRHYGASIELMARGELARFAAGRLGVADGHAIDRSEVSTLFIESDAAAARAVSFFGGFRRVYSFFAAENSGFRLMLTKVCTGEVSFHPFRPINFGGDGHVASAYLRSLGEGESIALGASGIELNAEDRASASRTLMSNRLDAGRFILLLPGSGSLRKNWPAGKFAELASRLPEDRRAAILLGPAEAELESYFQGQRLPVLKDLELGEVAAVAQMARGFVGNDSGVSHLAAAMQTPGVVLFGPTDPARWRPLGRITVLEHTPLESLTVSPVDEALAGLLRP
jgi:heptosyltransferase-3